MASATPVPSANAPGRDNSISRIFGALFSPKATFNSIARRPTWLLQTLLLCVLGLTAGIVFDHRGGWPSYLERQLETSARYQQASAEQQRQALRMQLKYGPPIADTEFFLIPFLAVLIVAAVFLGLFKGLGGAQFGFKTSLGIVAYAWAPGLISALLAILVVSVRDPATVDVQNIVASSAAAFLPSGSPRWMVALLGSLDLFSFWFMILMAMGYSAAAPKKFSFGKAFAWILCVWVFWVVVKVGLTAAFS
jgi:hypothetical protein